MTTTIELSWLELVLRANPDHVRESRFAIEYEFTAPSKTHGDERTHDGQSRVFRGNYDVRGPYAPETISAGGLTWNGIPLVFSDDNLTWGE